jgi:hypothetical protein
MRDPGEVVRSKINKSFICKAKELELYAESPRKPLEGLQQPWVA